MRTRLLFYQTGIAVLRKIQRCLPVGRHDNDGEFDMTGKKKKGKHR